MKNTVIINTATHISKHILRFVKAPSFSLCPALVPLRTLSPVSGFR